MNRKQKFARVVLWGNSGLLFAWWMYEDTRRSEMRGLVREQEALALLAEFLTCPLPSLSLSPHFLPPSLALAFCLPSHAFHRMCLAPSLAVNSLPKELGFVSALDIIFFTASKHLVRPTSKT